MLCFFYGIVQINTLANQPINEEKNIYLFYFLLNKFHKINTIVDIKTNWINSKKKLLTSLLL